MVRAFVAIGSNIDPAMNVRSAIELLARRLTVTKLSTVYKTRPEERPEQEDFYNCVVEIQTDLAPQDLKFQVLRSIETQLKRRRTPDKYAPRTVDLDLILYGDLVLDENGFVLPDPDIVRRFFLAAPLAELNPDLILPGSGALISDAAAQLPQDKAQPLPSYTARLREKISQRKLSKNEAPRK